MYNKVENNIEFFILKLININFHESLLFNMNTDNNKICMCSCYSITV